LVVIRHTGSRTVVGVSLAVVNKILVIIAGTVKPPVTNIPPRKRDILIILEMPSKRLVASSGTMSVH